MCRSASRAASVNEGIRVKLKAREIKYLALKPVAYILVKMYKLTAFAAFYMQMAAAAAGYILIGAFSAAAVTGFS